MPQTRVFFCSALILCLSACQKQPQHTFDDQPRQAKTPVMSFSCDQISQTIQSINNHSTVQALQEVNFRLKQCLPKLNMSERTTLLYASTAMYQRFLAADRTPKQQMVFEQYAQNTNMYPTLQQEHINEFSPRDRYLIEHQGQAFYELYDANGRTMYRRQPQYLKEIFAPYLPPAEQIFINHLAEQNQQPIFSRNTFNLTWSEIANRAQFWEHYAHQYPNSLFVEDAQRLKFAYIHFLFHGLPSMPVSNLYEGEDNINPEALMEIKMLSEEPHSQIAKKAQKFLQFLHISEHERDQRIPVELSPAEQRADTKEIIMESKQLDQFIGLNDPLAVDSTHINRDCFSDAICITHVGNVANKLPSKQQF